MTKLIKRASAEARAFGRKKQRDNDDDLDNAPRIETLRKPRFAPVTFSEENGVRYLHFGTEWIQGAMRIRKPDHLELEYAQQMMASLLFLETLERIVQLGLDAAALTKFCHRFLKRAKVEAVELNPAVVIAARAMFELPYDDAQLKVSEQDAWEFVNDRANHDTIGVLQIDIYNATGGPVLDSVSFYHACRACLTTEAGVVTINLFGDHPNFVRNMKHLNEAFDRRVIALPEVHDGNRIALAFAGPALDIPFDALMQRAKLIETELKLPARSWVNFVGVTILGFIAAHWRKGDLAQLDEWGLGGRRFGTIVT
ncbi:Spermidine synthase-like protein [Candidatus Burkholderia pumila]|uniref:Spermidine synthase-like protein n=1 Tax=Candidatus Burkholderia pumila TaxID=1090375 RepID=A0ABR5HN88_9BURK|nr:Spermidine synthase-like protein [Candidatus Burkholderia pumila]